MSPDVPGRGPARPAAVVNAEIRELWHRSAGRPTSQDRARYEQLVIEWAAARQREAAAGPGHDETALALP
ncbi:hypothetical protein D9753_22430 [Streptomyces dangxiongensis]|uniref:Integrase n=1 Tax=Streptomyces dangxiongensis TaxID=1442032 RepID=A0A3G2JIF4_9ACTN|nr:hypothetical protein [Streptomyces dangxiongensis]AYN41175.1 hypothetical protein D9753_22430 [Streptomyces dangxiongensis]